MVGGVTNGILVVNTEDPWLMVMGITGVPETDSVGTGGEIVKSVVRDSSLLDIVIGIAGTTLLREVTESPSPADVTGVILIGPVSVVVSGIGNGVTGMFVTKVLSEPVKVTETGMTGGMVAPDERLSVSTVGKVTETLVTTFPVESEKVMGIGTTEGSDGSDVVVPSGD